MRKRHAHVLAMLARARPARLDADAAPGTSWPAVAKLMQTAELADDGPVGEPYADHGGLRPSVRRRPPVPVKLLGAMTSAAVTAVVIVVAVFLGAVVFGAPHHQPTAARSSPGQPFAGQLVFRSIPLGPHWHGHVSYALSYGVVYLAGIATLDRGSQSGNDGPVATLPPSARPADQLSVVASVSVGADSIEIGAAGQIEVTGHHVAVTWVSLDGVSFPIGSG